MAIRPSLAAALLLLALSGGCREAARGPLVVSAIGGAPELANPNLKPLDPPSAMLVEGVAQGLVRFDAAGQIEPALAQSWIVSDDGLRYTFRIARATWANGAPVTAEQVVRRLRATFAGSSKNPLKPLLLTIGTVETMTPNVLEIALKSPRPNFLQLLAQPEMAIMRGELGTGPYRAEQRPNGSFLLSPADEEEQEDTTEEGISRDVILLGEKAPLAVARFRRGLADLVTGGTAGDLPVARAAALSGNPIRFDPVAGLFGLVFARDEGILAEAAGRRALSMAIDRPGLAAALGVPDLLPRESLLPAGLDEIAAPALPDWSGTPLPMRRALAARTIAELGEGEPVRLSVALPPGPGYRLLFAHLRRDWRAIGVTAEAAEPGTKADLRLIDSVAPANLAAWYLRRFSCAAGTVCSPEADALLDQARTAIDPAERRALIAGADGALAKVVPFIPLTAPVRWSLVSPRLAGFQPNPFGRRFLGSLLARRR